ncbi:MAG: thioredoxin domain-containing protein [Thiobacillaceae bacterium]
MPNRLAQETSPYLRQHADNPVDWYPWGEEALARAQAEDKPILLSIGYASCHWCHVMAHECFEDPEVAAVMNRHFINIKVDREERPDLDQIYQSAHQLLARRPGGWPLTVFLTPDRVPFFAGTYFPKTPRYGLPGFIEVLEHIATAYRRERAAIEDQNAALLEALAAAERQPGAATVAETAVLQAALIDLKAGYDPMHGGYGRAPKFPRPTDLAFLLHGGDAEARAQVLTTLRHMAERGLMDQVGGGFYRYSVDERWAIPHFEKMLYDNGPLLGLYADAWALTGEAVYRRAVELTVDWLDREMTTPEGLFWSALDADSEGEEGRYYLWTPQAVEALLSPEEWAVAAPRWGLDQPPNFEGRAWHLGSERPLEAIAHELAISSEAAAKRLEQARRKLLAARQARGRPGLDDKVLTAWNALTIQGLARAARRFDRPDLAERATQAVDALRARVWREGRLYASWQGGTAKLNGYLDDHAFLLAALLELMQARFRVEYLAWAQALADRLLDRFEDPERGGFWFTSHDHESLIQRLKPVHDNATPAGNAVAALALIRLGHLLGEPRYLAAAERTLLLNTPGMRAQPAAYPGLLMALREYLYPTAVVVMRGPADALAEWHRRLQPICPDNALCLAIPADVVDLPDVLTQPVHSYVSARVCTGVDCSDEIVRFDYLRAILNV